MKNKKKKESKKKKGQKAEEPVKTEGKYETLSAKENEPPVSEDAVKKEEEGEVFKKIN